MNKSESKIQSEAFLEFWNNCPQWRGALYHNFSNPRNARNGAILKAQGLIDGNPDLTLAVKSKKYGALYIEVKKEGEKPRKNQLEQHEKLRLFGNKVVICFTKDEILREIFLYLQDI